MTNDALFADSNHAQPLCFRKLECASEVILYNFASGLLIVYLYGDADSNCFVDSVTDMHVMAFNYN